MIQVLGRIDPIHGNRLFGDIAQATLLKVGFFK
jgi:hypothetical protein